MLVESPIHVLDFHKSPASFELADITTFQDVLAGYFDQRVNFYRINSFLEENPYFLPEFEAELQNGINALNMGQRFDDGKYIIPGASLVVDKIQREGTKLPAFLKILNPYDTKTRLAVGIMNHEMARGEAGDKTPPYIDWHARPSAAHLADESLTAGVLMDTWGIRAALELFPDFDASMTEQDEINLKKGTFGGIGSEMLMPTVEQIVGIQNAHKRQSKVLRAIQPWLGIRYGFSNDFLKMVQSTYPEISLHPKAFQPKTFVS